MIDAIVRSEPFLLTLTIALYLLGGAIFRRTKVVLLHPTLLTAAAIIAFLSLLDIDYATYRESTQIIDFALGLAVVALGYLMYEQSERITRRELPVFAATLAGTIVGLLSVVLIAKAFGTERDIITSIAPKSVTVPIAIAVAEPRGGLVAVTSVVVFCTGILGSIFGPAVLSLFCVKYLSEEKGYEVHTAIANTGGFSKEELAKIAERAEALGAASHGIGTARAIEIGAAEGAMAGLAMALTGVATAVLFPIVEKYLY